MTLMAGFHKLSYTHYVEALGSQTAFILSVLFFILVAVLIISLHAKNRTLEVVTATHVAKEDEASIDIISDRDKESVVDHTERKTQLSETHGQGDCLAGTSAVSGVVTATHVSKEDEVRNDIPDCTERAIELSASHSRGDCPAESSAAAEVVTATHVSKEDEVRIEIPDCTERAIELSASHSRGDCPAETSAAAEVGTATHVAEEDEERINTTLDSDRVSLLDRRRTTIQLSETHGQRGRLAGTSVAAEHTIETGSGQDTNRDEPEQSQTHSEGEVGDLGLKTELKVVCWVVPIPAGGIISVLAGLPGNEKAVLPHKVLFKVYTFLLFSSFLSCGVVFMFIIIRPKLRCLTTVVRIVMWISLVLVTYAMAFAICVLLPMGLMGLVLVLVSPIVLVGLAMVFCIMKKCN